MSAVVVFPAPLKPVNQTQKPCPCLGGYACRSTAATSGRMNHSGMSRPPSRYSSLSSLPEMESVRAPSGTADCSS
jgi:hypothetical protein